VLEVHCSRDLERLLADGFGIAILPASAVRNHQVRHLACSKIGVERTVAIYSVAGRQRSKKRSFGAPAKIVISRVPVAAATCWYLATWDVVAMWLTGHAATSLVDGQPFHAQVERVGLAYRVAHGGAQVEVRVLSPRAAELQALMPFKPPPDLSRFLLSPMPGLLVDVAVSPGQAVRAGERLAVIEAMKMENILVAANAGVVAKVVAQKGASLAVDDVILEFERAEATK